MKAILVAIFTIMIASPVVISQTSDAALRRVINADSAAKAANDGKLPNLAASEHLSRAETYMANRLFPEAREHWSAVLRDHSQDPGVPKALFGTARSFMWEREYLKAVEWFDRLLADHAMTKEGREGLAFKGASYVRAGRNLEAAKTYEQYTVMFPQGERIESAYLNIIDAYREAGEYSNAEEWIERAARDFPGRSTEANALQARVRMELFRGRWADAVAAADRMLAIRSFAGSMTSADEGRFLKALALEKLGRRSEAQAAFSSIPNTPTSYFGGLSADRVEGSSVRKIVQSSPRLLAEYPAPFSSLVLKHAKKQRIDPRFVLAIMKQESSFRPGAKSPAGARGLVQLVFDTAIKYKDEAGYRNLQPDELYDPETNIAIGSIYIRKIKDEFGGLYEAVAASYNAGEDNAARWLRRTSPKEPGVFAAEVGFAETKNYVFKVMNNYRIYRELYTEDLRQK
ncbi:MAG TPA: transglycosylase SLT domain-containing protein [Pyrinomonadaceae bacterium]|nr:transglycosylase SLT domain-containing protein [Pyrinomonadaceae bacterium]